MENLDNLIHMVNVCNRITELREGCGMTQEELAYKANIDPRTVQHTENLKLPKKIEIWICLAEALDVTLDFLLFGKEN